RTLTQQRLAVNLSVSENSAGNPPEFGKELPPATKNSVFSTAESREGLRPARCKLAFHLHSLPTSVVLKNTDISTTKAAVELAVIRGWRGLLFAVWRRFYESYALCFSWFGITSRGFGSTGPGTSSEGKHSV